MNTDTKPEDCKEHNWVEAGRGLTLDPATGKEREYVLYTCSICGTSKTDWAD